MFRTFIHPTLFVFLFSSYISLSSSFSFVLLFQSPLSYFSLSNFFTRFFSLFLLHPFFFTSFILSLLLYFPFSFSCFVVFISFLFPFRCYVYSASIRQRHKELLYFFCYRMKTVCSVSLKNDGFKTSDGVLRETRKKHANYSCRF